MNTQTWLQLVALFIASVATMAFPLETPSHVPLDSGQFVRVILKQTEVGSRTKVRVLPDSIDYHVDGDMLLICPPAENTIVHVMFIEATTGDIHLHERSIKFGGEAPVKPLQDRVRDGVSRYPKSNATASHLRTLAAKIESGERQPIQTLNYLSIPALSEMSPIFGQLRATLITVMTDQEQLMPSTMVVALRAAADEISGDD